MNILSIIIPNDQFLELKKKVQNEDIGDTHLFEMDIEDFIQMNIDMIIGEMKAFLRKTKAGEMLNHEHLILSDEIDTEISSDNIILIETMEPTNVLRFFNRNFYNDILWGHELKFETYYNPLEEEDIKQNKPEINKSHNIDYSKMRQKEIQNLLDQALDNKDYNKAKELSKYIREGLMMFENFVKYKYKKGKN